MSDAEERRGAVIYRDFGGRAEARERSDRLFPCRHETTEVDEVARTVTCASCSAPLDAFQVLLEYSRNERHWRGWQSEVDRCQAELKELKAEERRVKARTKSAARKDAQAAVAEERVRSERERIETTQDARDIQELCRRIERRLQRRRKL